MALPANLKYGIVTGKFIRVTFDSNDVDREPDSSPVAGILVEFTPDIDAEFVTDTIDGVTVYLEPVYGITNSSGVLVPANPNNPTELDPTQIGILGVPLLSPDDSLIDPGNWSWNVKITAPGKTPRGFSFHLGQEGADLASVVRTPIDYGEDLTDWMNIVSVVEAARDATIAAAAGGGGGGVPADHTHPALDIEDSTVVGRAVLTAADAAAGRLALGAQVSGSYASSTHTHVATGISDSTAIGRSVLTAADAAAVRTAIGAQVAGSYQASGSYASSTHTHPATGISDSSVIGRTILTAADAAAVRTATGAQVAGSYAAATHTHNAVDIANSTTIGRSVMTAVDAAAVRTAISAAEASATTSALTARAIKTNQIDHIFWNKTTRVWTPHDMTYGTHHCHSENDATAEAPDGYSDFDIWWKRAV